MPQQSKPPLGVEPEFIWRERRVDDLRAAIARRQGYLDEDPEERPRDLETLRNWERELDEHLCWLSLRRPGEAAPQLDWFDKVLLGVVCLAFFAGAVTLWAILQPVFGWLGWM